MSGLLGGGAWRTSPKKSQMTSLGVTLGGVRVGLHLGRGDPVEG